MSKPAFSAGAVSALLFCLLPNILGYSQTKSAQPAGTASISGRVFIKGEPIRGVMVSLQSQQPGQVSNMRNQAKTDGNGQFRLTGIQAGRYSLMALAPGFYMPGESDYGFRGKTILLSEGEQVENIDIEIVRGGVIAGRVTDANGRPVVEERVTLMRIGRSGKPERVQEFQLGVNYEAFMTNDRGEYRVYGLPEGKYIVSVGASTEPGALVVSSATTFFSRTFHPNAASEAEAKIVEVTGDEDATGIDITLGEERKAYRIFGRVVDSSTGLPVAGVVLSYGLMAGDGKRMSSSGSKGERSNANGEFKLMGMSPGKYGVSVAEGNSYRSPGEENVFISDPVPCEVVDGDVHGIEVRVRLGASISGVLVFEGAAAAKKIDPRQIMLFAQPQPSPGAPPSSPYISPGNTGPDGSFRIAGLREGKMQLRLGGSPFPGLTILRTEHNGEQKQDGIDLRAGEQISGVRVLVTMGTITLRGEVKVIGGNLPLNRFYISLRKSGPSPTGSGAQVDARGQFAIENLMPGEYELRLSPMYGLGQESPDQTLLKALHDAHQKIILTAENPAPVTFMVDLTPKEGKQ